MSLIMQTKTVELYNLTEANSNLTCNGWLVRVEEGRFLNGPAKTTFVRFGRDEAAARAFARASETVSK